MNWINEAARIQDASQRADYVNGVVGMPGSAGRLAVALASAAAIGVIGHYSGRVDGRMLIPQPDYFSDDDEDEDDEPQQYSPPSAPPLSEAEQAIHRRIMNASRH